MSKFKTLYEDEHLLAVSKPRGLLTVAHKPNQPNLFEYVKNKYAKDDIKIRALHRLDRDTSGIVLFCKTKKCFEEAVVNRKFKNVKKTYIAITEGIPKGKTGEIDFPLPSREHKNVKIPAKTKFKVLREYKFFGVRAALIEAEISSGRFHQIRSHFEMIGHPLLMDREYMKRENYKKFQKIVEFRHYFLHAYKVDFIHFVTGEPIKIICKAPEELRKIFILPDRY